MGKQTYKLWKRDLARVQAAALPAARREVEVGGLLIDAGYGFRMRPITNISRRLGSFLVKRSEVRALQRAVRLIGWEVVGTYHSHILADAVPGPTDISGTIDDSLMLVLQPFDRTARLWRIKGGRARELHFEVVP